MTVTGMRDVFVMVFIHVKSRQVIVTPAIQKPNEVWMMEQVGRVVAEARKRGLRIRTVMRDQDTKYSTRYQDRLRQLRLVDRPVQSRSPYQNAYTERDIQTIQQECLDHFVIFGERHLRVLLREFVAHYLTERSHQGLGGQLIVPNQAPENDNGATGAIRCRSRLGGLLKFYHREAA